MNGVQQTLSMDQIICRKFQINGRACDTESTTVCGCFFFAIISAAMSVNLELFWQIICVMLPLNS